MPIKVVNPKQKRDSKTFMLRIKLDEISNLKCLKEEILEQLGKRYIRFNLKFDVGYLSDCQRIHFSESDDIKHELACLIKKGKSLWCDGLEVHVVDSNGPIIVDDSDFEEEQPAKKQKSVNALESKASGSMH